MQYGGPLREWCPTLESSKSQDLSRFGDRRGGIARSLSRWAALLHLPADAWSPAGGTHHCAAANPAISGGRPSAIARQPVEFHRQMHFTSEFMPKVDGGTMYYALEGGAPFLDHMLWELPLACQKISVCVNAS